MVNDFAYYLRFDDGGTWKYYYVDTAGVVQNTATKTALTYAPKGWRDKGLKWERGFTYHGVFQTFTIPLEFVKDGAKILRYLYVNYGTEGECELYIEKFNRTAAVYDYEAYYMGEIDFSRYNDRKDFVQCEVMEGGFMAKLKAKENTNFEIAVTDSPSRVWVNMDGRYLWVYFSFTGLNQPEDNITSPTYDVVAGVNMPTLLYVNTEGYSNGDIHPKGNEFLGTYSQFFQAAYTGGISAAMGDKYFIHNSSSTESYDYNIRMTATVGTIADAGSSTAASLRLFRFQKGTNVITQDHLLVTGQTYSPGANGVEDLIVDTVITVDPNECLILQLQYANSTDPHKTHIFAIDCKVSVLNQVTQAYVPARRSHDVMTELLAGIDATAVNSPSSILRTNEGEKVLTSFNAMRGLEKAVIVTNFTELYKAVAAQFHACMKFTKATNTVLIAYRETAYEEATQILDLGDVSNLVITPLTSEMFAKLKIGYPDIKYDEVNGKEEFNIMLEFQSNLIRVVSERDIVSPYRGDSIGIESNRARYVEKIDADSDSDNDTCWLHIEASPAGMIPTGLPGAGENYYNLERSGYTITTGLSNPNLAYNLYLSPKKMMYKNGGWIRSVLYPHGEVPGTLLRYQAASKNPNDQDSLEWDDGSVIVERGDEDINDFDAAYFIPTVFEFDCKIPQNILSIITSNPYGKVKFTYNGNDFYGFILSVQDEPVTKPKQSYKLLCSISTNLDNLIV